MGQSLQSLGNVLGIPAVLPWCFVLLVKPFEGIPNRYRAVPFVPLHLA